MANKSEPILTSVTTAYELNGELNLVLQAKDGGDQTGLLTFRTTSWDEEEKKLMPDEIMKEETDKQLTELFALTFDEIKENPLSIVGQELEAYWDEAYQKFRMTQPVSFTRYERITSENVKQIKEFASTVTEDNPLITLPIEDHYGVRIKVGIEIPEIGNFRLSQLSDEIVNGKLNYATAKVNTLKKSLDAATDKETKDTLQTIYEANVKTSKANCLLDLKASFGVDFERLLDIHGHVALAGLEMKDFTLEGKKNYYLVGILAEDQDLEINEELEKEFEENKELED